MDNWDRHFDRAEAKWDREEKKMLKLGAGLVVATIFLNLLLLGAAVAVIILVLKAFGIV